MEHKNIGFLKMDVNGFISILKSTGIVFIFVIVLNLLKQFNINFENINIGNFNLGFLDSYYNIAVMFISRLLEKWILNYKSIITAKATEIENLSI